NGPISHEIAIFNATIDDMLAGYSRGCIISDCGNTYWDIEEASFIRCMRDPDAFYTDMLVVLKELLPDDITDIVRYQQSRIPTIEMFDGDVDRWARETILWGRKSGTMLVPE
ncbi:hypothetical protein LCGC14_1982110, partial [marine sediment metagenome]